MLPLSVSCLHVTAGNCALFATVSYPYSVRERVMVGNCISQSFKYFILLKFPFSRLVKVDTCTWPNRASVPRRGHAGSLLQEV